MVKEMKEICDTYKLERVTFPIRSSLLFQSEKQLKWLLRNVPKSTITLWSAEPVTSDLWNWILKSWGPTQMFIDVKFASQIKSKL